MATREDDTAAVTLTGTELKPPMMDWSVEYVYKVFTVLKTLTIMYLETKGVPDHKQVYVHPATTRQGRSLPLGICSPCSTQQ